MSDIDLDHLREWITSPEGLQSIRDAHDEAMATVEQLQRDRRVCWCELRGMRHGPWCPNWTSPPQEPQDGRWEALARVAAAESERDEILGVLALFIDDEPCWYDHHGCCQAHSMSEPPCAVALARALLGMEKKERTL